MIRIGRKDLQDFEPALDREWLVTNGLGGYASSTVLGINTRKYHGLLVAALKPPVDRVLLVSRVEETLLLGESRFELGASEYEDTIYPDGFRYLDEVTLDPLPTFTYVVNGVKLHKSIFMVHGENTTCIVYSIESLPGGPKREQVGLEVRPIVAFRDHHGLAKETRDFDRTVGATPGLVKIKPYSHLPALNIAFGKGIFQEAGYWYRNHHYRREKESGYPSNEDLYSPGTVTFSCRKDDPLCLAFSTSETVAADSDLKRLETERRAALVAGGAAASVAGHRLGRHLLAAADAFVVRRGEKGRSVIAGYPWFTDWGRDTMISLPGLALASGRFEDAKRILNTYVASMNYGLIPNLFPDFSRDTEYNTLDATLWLFEAVRKYYAATGDGESVTAILPGLRDAISAHIKGTLYGIKLDEDGLIAGGVEGVQLTWMDAKIGNKVITARIGKPVEINALWYNALRIMADFCADFGGLAEERRFDEMATKTFEAFNRRFWNAERDCLYDYLNGSHKDDSVRPNQVIAISLTYPVLDPSRWKSVVDVVERELLTPFGLRTLSPNDSRYRGAYQGDLEARDNAYHQGTVWPWLLGPYMTAYLRAHGRSRQTLAYCRRLLEPILAHLSDAGLGQISEIFDGDPPHKPRGCIAQAWSVGEILRVISEELAADPHPGQRESEKTGSKPRQR
ncbi:MAG: amylo-alpha-1,6-glucosidase [Candidatus Eisenbacteria bacterium]